MYGKKFFYVKKKIKPEKLEEIILLGDKSFIQEYGIARVYPNGNFLVMLSVRSIIITTEFLV